MLFYPVVDSIHVRELNSTQKKKKKNVPIYAKFFTRVREL